MFTSSVVLGAATVVGFVLAAGPLGAAGVAAVRTLVAGVLGTTAGLWWLRRLGRSGTLAPRASRDVGDSQPAAHIDPTPEPDVLVARTTVVS